MLTRKQYELLRFINERLKEAGDIGEGQAALAVLKTGDHDRGRGEQQERRREQKERQHAEP